MPKCLMLVLSASLLIILSNGCILTERCVKVGYIAETPVSRPGMGEVVYLAKARDNHSRGRPLVGERRNRYNREFKILLEEGLDLSAVVTSAVRDSLTVNGYTVRGAVFC